MSAAVTAPIVAAGVAAFKMGADLEDAMGATDQIFKKFLCCSETVGG